MSWSSDERNLLRRRSQTDTSTGHNSSESEGSCDQGSYNMKRKSHSNQLIDDNGQIIHEMTEEEEQQIYEIPQGRGSVSNSSPKRSSLLQQITSLGLLGGSSISNNNNNNNNHQDGVKKDTQNPFRQSKSTSSSGRLKASYDLLESEYCKLKFEQTELVALADQRKMEKQRSAELMESLENDLNEHRNENARLRYEKEQLLEELQRISNTNKNKSNDLISQSKDQPLTHENHELNKLSKQRDLTRAQLDNAREELEELRRESKKLIETLQLPPVVPDGEPELEHYRMRKLQKVTDMESYLDDLTFRVEQLRVARNASTVTTTSRSPTPSSSMIGKEIIIDEGQSESDGSETI